MSKGIVETIGGALAIAGGIFLETIPGMQAVGALLIQAGVGLTLSGVGTMLSKGPLQGFQTTTRNPIAPWNIVYGRARVGGTIVYINTFGDNDKWMDLVIVLAAHPCQSMDGLYLDQQRILFGSPGVNEGTLGSRAFSATSIDVTAANINTPFGILDIARANNVVTVQINGVFSGLQDGDLVDISAVTGDRTLNGRWPVTPQAPISGHTVFTYVSGGLPSHVTSQGHASLTYPNYGRKIWMEVMLGQQTLGNTFQGMLHGTPEDGDTGTLALTPTGSTQNPWTANCSLVGMSAVHLRLHYNDTFFANGLPQISFHIHGKQDITDPRTSTVGYTENAALCIADYLSNTTFGFKCVLGTDIPTAPLIAAANICDEAVTLAHGGTEPRYTLNGGFVLTMRRGEILQNMLTSCAGRLTYVGGQFFIWPGAWYGNSAVVGFPADYGTTPAAYTGTTIYSLSTAPWQWKPVPLGTDRYNGVKGTYISPANQWQSTDFPRYAQDITHGFSSDQFLIADGGDRRWLDIQLPFTNSSSMAQRIAKIELMRRRQLGTGTFRLNMAGYTITPMDIIAMDLPYFGWTGKTLEVLSTRLTLSRQGGGGSGDGASAAPFLLGVEIDVQEADPTVYAWSIGEELSPQGYQQAITPFTSNPAPPTNVIVSNGANSLIVTWTAPADAYVLNGGHIEIQYQVLASPPGLWLSLAKMDPSVVTATISNLQSGVSYTVRIRSVNQAGIPSAWVIATPAGGTSPGPITVRSSFPINAWFDAPISGDPLFQSKNFGVTLDYTLAADGTLVPQAVVFGNPPISVLSTLTQAPVLNSVTAVASGGSITGGITYTVGVSALDSAGDLTKLSNLVSVAVPAGSGYKLTLSVTWAAGSFGGQIYICRDVNRGLRFEANTADAGSSTTGTTNEDLLTAVGLGVGAPDPSFDHVVVNVSRELVSGPFAQEAAAISTNTISLGGTPTAGQFNGRILSKLANDISHITTRIPIQDFTITSNDGSGNFTVTPDPLAAGCLAGDLFTLRTGGPSAANPISATATSFTDPVFVNFYNSGGLTAHKNGGNLVFVIGGTGAGQTVQTVVDNTNTVVTVSPGWDVIPDSTSVIVLVEPTAQVSVPGGPIQLSNYTNWQGLLATAPIPNYPAVVVRVELFGADANGVVGAQQFVAAREGYMWGAGGARLITGVSTATALLTDGSDYFDTTSVTGFTDTLGASIPDTTSTSITLSSGANAVNGTVIQVDSERMYIDSGSGATRTVERGYAGTTAATHSSGATVSLPGALTFTLLAGAVAPNVQITLNKFSTDINYVLYQVAGGSGDTLPGGGTSGILPDNSAARGTIVLQASGV